MVVLLATTAWAACEGPRRSVQSASVQANGSVTTTRGDEITLRGRITAAFGPHVFAVGSGAERVIVVTATPVAAWVGRDVDVTGRVQTFRREELEAQLGVDLGAVPDALENGTCLVASVAHVR